MRQIRYRGSGTGLRLNGDDDTTALDVGGSQAPSAPLHLYVQQSEYQKAGIDLVPAEVALLMEQCAIYLARHHGVKQDPK